MGEGAALEQRRPGRRRAAAGQPDRHPDDHLAGAVARGPGWPATAACDRSPSCPSCCVRSLDERPLPLQVDGDYIGEVHEARVRRAPRRDARRGLSAMLPRRAAACGRSARRRDRRGACWPGPPCRRRRPAQALAAGPVIAGCRVLPADNPWNQRVDRLPVARDSAALIAAIGLDVPSTPTSAPSTTARRTASRSRSCRTPCAALPVRFNYASESDRGRYPLPRDVADRGRAARHRRPPRDRRRPRHLHRLRALRRLSRTAGYWTPAPARSSTSAPTTCGPPAGPRPTPPACRSCPGSPATPRSRRARSTTRCASPRRARRRTTSTRRATTPPTCSGAPRRRWGCGCGSRRG